MVNALDKIFVKRFKVGFKGTTEFDNLIPAKNMKEARLIYARRRGIKPNEQMFKLIKNKK